MAADIQTLARFIDDARRVVIFTGAGLSTESGIPDFRSPTGIWSRTTPIYFDEYVSSVDARREAWRRKFEIDKDMIGAEPNRGHRAVVEALLGVELPPLPAPRKPVATGESRTPRACCAWRFAAACGCQLNRCSPPL